MIIDKKYSLKPFGYGTSCIDCINGECVRNVSVEECKKICEESNWCGCGIHVDFLNRSIPNYCLPLNTIKYKNNPIISSMISTDKNGTFLSRENGVDITFFREEKQFPLNQKVYDKLKINKKKNISKEDLVDKNVEDMNKNMKIYLDTYFPDMTDRKESFSFQSLSIIHKVILCGIFFLILFFILKS